MITLEEHAVSVAHAVSLLPAIACHCRPAAFFPPPHCSLLQSASIHTNLLVKYCLTWQPAGTTALHHKRTSMCSLLLGCMPTLSSESQGNSRAA